MWKLGKALFGTDWRGNPHQLGRKALVFLISAENVFRHWHRLFIGHHRPRKMILNSFYM